jgi:hypothetical protein
MIWVEMTLALNEAAWRAFLVSLCLTGRATWHFAARGIGPEPIKKELHMRGLSILLVAGLSFLGLAACGDDNPPNTSGSGGAGGAGGAMSCTLDGGQCPTGYRCACGGPGAVGVCTCHKECSSAAECTTGQDTMCGCGSGGPSAPGAGLCVSSCFCFCG